MAYFLTGGTGFIGRFLVEKLLARGGEVYLLVRPASLGKLEALKERWGEGADRVHAVEGDLTQAGLGLDSKTASALAGKVDHFFHLGAVYDMASDEVTQHQANVEGTRHALEAASALEAGCFHHVSSIAAAGLYQGTFREDMFEQATR
ncbi:MAG: SDR family oxidoreductase, partial [Marinobacter sp.]